MVDETKLNTFIGKILGDLGGAFSVPMVRMGDKLGLYKALNEQGPMTPRDLAAKTKIAERYAREWLSHQAASGYLDYEPGDGQVHLAARTGDGVRERRTVPSTCRAPSTSRWR